VLHIITSMVASTPRVGRSCRSWQRMVDLVDLRHLRMRGHRQNQPSLASEVLHIITSMVASTPRRGLLATVDLFSAEPAIIGKRGAAHHHFDGSKHRSAWQRMVVSAIWWLRSQMLSRPREPARLRLCTAAAAKPGADNVSHCSVSAISMQCGGFGRNCEK
jgi:hypothetical protein